MAATEPLTSHSTTSFGFWMRSCFQIGQEGDAVPAHVPPQGPPHVEHAAAVAIAVAAVLRRQAAGHGADQRRMRSWSRRSMADRRVCDSMRSRKASVSPRASSTRFCSTKAFTWSRSRCAALAQAAGALGLRRGGDVAFQRLQAHPFQDAPGEEVRLGEQGDVGDAGLGRRPAPWRRRAPPGRPPAASGRAGRRHPRRPRLRRHPRLHRPAAARPRRGAVRLRLGSRKIAALEEQVEAFGEGALLLHRLGEDEGERVLEPRRGRRSRRPAPPANASMLSAGEMRTPAPRAARKKSQQRAVSWRRLHISVPARPPCRLQQQLADLGLTASMSLSNFSSTFSVSRTSVAVEPRGVQQQQRARPVDGLADRRQLPQVEPAELLHEGDELLRRAAAHAGHAAWR